MICGISAFIDPETSRYTCVVPSRRGDSRLPRGIRQERQPQGLHERAPVRGRQNRYAVVVRRVAPRARVPVRHHVGTQDRHGPALPAAHRLVFAGEERLVGIGADAAAPGRAPDARAVHLLQGSLERLLQHGRERMPERVVAAEKTANVVRNAAFELERAGVAAAGGGDALVAGRIARAGGFLEVAGEGFDVVRDQAPCVERVPGVGPLRKIVGGIVVTRRTSCARPRSSAAAAWPGPSHRRSSRTSSPKRRGRTRGG